MRKPSVSRGLGSWPSLCDFDQGIGFLLTSRYRWLNQVLSRAFLAPRF